MKAVFGAVACGLLLVGCGSMVKEATMTNGQKGYIASCPGTGVTWSTCHELAIETCPNGFNAEDKEQFVHSGYVKRNLYFTCK